MKLLGTQFDYVAKVLAARRFAKASRPSLGKNAANDNAVLAQQYSRVIMQIVVSVLGLIGSFFVIRSSNSEAAHKPAYVIVGTILGYWLR
jgi:hypothetical protein